MRTFTKSTLQIGLAAAALMLLAGAKGDGCNNGETEPVPPSEICEAGFHIEQICEPACDAQLGAPELDDGSVPYGCDVLACKDTCVPDEQCPDGTYEQWVCYGGGVEPGDPGEPSDPGSPEPLSHPCYEGDPDCGGHGEEECFLECVPVDHCGPGYHEEWVCEVDGGPKPLPAEEQDGSDGDEPTEPPGDCFLTCVPDGCPPGTIEQVVCEDVVYADGEEDQNDDEFAPPEWQECWTECVPEPTCPEGTHPEEICEQIDLCSEPVCKIICVDDCGKNCDPTLICGDALTCVGGLLYPSTCGPDNCDEPIGLCGDDCDPTLACPEVLTCVDGLLYPTGCGPENCDQPIGDCGTPEL